MERALMLRVYYRNDDRLNSFVSSLFKEYPKYRYVLEYKYDFTHYIPVISEDDIISEVKKSFMQFVQKHINDISREV